MILESPGADQPHIFLRFLKKKESNVWEKPSAKEGKVLKLNLLEIIRLRDLCIAEKDTWSSVHAFGAEKTSFTFEKDGKNIKIALQGYSKFIQYPESELLKELLIHLVKEKVENATNSSTPNSDPGNKPKDASLTPKPGQPNPQPNLHPPEIDVNEDIEYPEDLDLMDSADASPASGPIKNINEWVTRLPMQGEFYEVQASINRKAAKAWLLKNPWLKEFWVPISVMAPHVLAAVDQNGLIPLKKWWIERNLDKFELVVT
jgi:hypothetical protein